MAWEKTFDIGLKVAMFAVALGSAVYAFVEYLDSKEKDYYQQFWNVKLRQYEDVSKAAATMANATSLDEFNTARATYWIYFYGPLSLVEGPCVKKAMQTFSGCVPAQPITDPTSLPRSKMAQPAYRLSTRLRDELARNWQTPFSELNPGSDQDQVCDFKPDPERC